MTTNQTATAADVAALAGPGITAQDVEAFAETVRHFLPSGMTPESALGVAVFEARADAEQRLRRVLHGDVRYRRALVGALSGTYDEFRAEAS